MKQLSNPEFSQYIAFAVVLVMALISTIKSSKLSKKLKESEHKYSVSQEHIGEYLSMLHDNDIEINSLKGSTHGLKQQIQNLEEKAEHTVQEHAQELQAYETTVTNKNHEISYLKIKLEEIESRLITVSDTAPSKISKNGVEYSPKQLTHNAVMKLSNEIHKVIGDKIYSKCDDGERVELTILLPELDQVPHPEH